MIKFEHSEALLRDFWPFSSDFDRFSRNLRSTMPSIHVRQSFSQPCCFWEAKIPRLRLPPLPIVAPLFAPRHHSQFYCIIDNNINKFPVSHTQKEKEKIERKIFVFFCCLLCAVEHLSREFLGVFAL